MLVFGAIALYAHTQTQVNKKIYLNKATLFEHLNSIREKMTHRYNNSFHIASYAHTQTQTQTNKQKYIFE